MGKLQSSIPGLGYPSGRDDKLKTGKGFMDGRRQDDGAEGLWRIRNGLYDLNDFIKSHPGGEEWLQLTRGTDITEVFESHHLDERAHNLLPKFYIRDAVLPRRCPLTFEPDGFFYKFKKRALIALQDVNYHQPANISNTIADIMVVSTILLHISAASTQHWFNILLAALFLSWTTIISHNFLHMKDNFRVYYFDLSMWSSKEYRVIHVLSHHMYPNTLWDLEIYSFEPFLNWLPDDGKTFQIWRIISIIISPFVWTVIFVTKAMNRYYLAIFEYHYLEIRDIIAFILPVLMSLAAPSVFVTLKTWIIIMFLSSFWFGLIAVNSAHHHPDIFHDGDIYRKNMDWGLLEVDAVRDRKILDDSLFFVLTHYGLHVLHHFLPTIDHAYLPLCRNALIETCAEFNINYDENSFTQWDLFKGQFMQLLRREPKCNSR